MPVETTRNVNWFTLAVQSEPRFRGGSDFLLLPLDLFRSPASGERLLDPIQRGMTSVLHLDPMADALRRPTHRAVIYVPTGLVVMALRNASGEAMVEMVCVPSPTP